MYSSHFGQVTALGLLKIFEDEFMRLFETPNWKQCEGRFSPHFQCEGAVLVIYEASGGQCHFPSFFLSR